MPIIACLATRKPQRAYKREVPHLYEMPTSGELQPSMFTDETLNYLTDDLLDYTFTSIICADITPSSDY